jgi:tryptophan synthase alpha subunit
VTGGQYRHRRRGQPPAGDPQAREAADRRGFGIRDGATARAVAEVADAVVIGSRIIQEIETAGKDHAVAAVQAFATTIRTALDA